MVYSLQLTSPLVDENRRATRAFAAFLQQVGGSTANSLGARVTTLETDVAALDTRVDALELTVSAQALSISANTAAIADAEIRSLWVRPWR